MRKPIIAGNWKMNMISGEAKDLAEGIKNEVRELSGVDVVLCPPFTSLSPVSEAISGTSVYLGAQNMNAAASGAYTGEVSAMMLKDLYVNFVILGHSERRTIYGETDEMVNEKVKTALESKFKPIICVGETQEQREKGVTEKVVEEQTRGCYAGLSADQALETVIAYEPVWAIGTGLTASPEQAQEVHAFIRGIVADMFGQEVADAIRIQYGGSMKPANAKELLSQADIDGGLIGGAALEVSSFVDIIKAAV